MAKDSSRIEPARCVAIERATGYSVKRQELRADWREIWPELPEDWDGKTERRKQVRRAADRKAKGR